MSDVTNVRKLTQRHFVILDYALAGMQAVDIAKKLEMSPAQINNILRSPSFQHQFAIRRSSREEQIDSDGILDLKDEVRSTLKANALAAAKKITTLMNCDDSKIALKSATEILDRSGYAKEMPKPADNSTSVNIVIGDKQAIVINDTLQMLTGTK